MSTNDRIWIGQIVALLQAGVYGLNDKNLRGASLILLNEIDPTFLFSPPSDYRACTAETFLKDAFLPLAEGYAKMKKVKR